MNRLMYALLGSGLAVVIVPFFVYEGLRFYTAFATCNQMQAQNLLLLNDRSCFDPIERHVRGEKQEALCKRAEEENQISPASCAWRNMWLNGEVYHVWSMITRSHVMLAVIIVPCSMLTIWLCFWSCISHVQHTKQLQLQERMYTKTLEQLRPQQQQEQAYRLPLTHDFDRRAKYIKLIRKPNINNNNYEEED